MANLTPDRLRSIDSADVYKSDRWAGRLTRDGDRITFAYTDDYLIDPAAAPISWTLPKIDRPAVATGGSMPPFFAGLLPEGIRLRAIVTAAKTSEDDHFTILLSVGGDTVGDVRVVPTGESPNTPTPLVDDTDAIPDLGKLFALAADPTTVADDSTALPGVQVKVSAARYSVLVRVGSNPAILKLAPTHGEPRLVQNEHYFMNLARTCGLPVAEQRLIQDRKGRAGLLVERFDRAHTAEGSLIRLAQEDACQVSGLYPASKYRMKTESVVRTLADTCERGGGSARQAALALLRLAAYSYAIGNGDLHGKNYSIQQGTSGVWTVTPGYDLLCTQPYLGWRDPMALDLYGRANRLTRAHFGQAAERLGVPERAMGRALDTICQGVTAGAAGVAEIGFDARATELLRELLLRRVDELS